MDEVPLLLILLLAAMLASVGLLVVLLLRRPERALEAALREEQRAGRGELRAQLDGLGVQQGQRIDGFGVQLQAGIARTEQRMDEFTQRTEARLDELRATLAEDARKARGEAAGQQQRQTEALAAQLRELTARNEQRIGEMRDTLEKQLLALQRDNAARLEQMRATVDEKLQNTLNQRLDSSFKLVSERLEQVQRGLGEMQQLATGVGDLKRVLTNVKNRGGWGEVQLGNILEQTLVHDQYARNVRVRDDSSEAVDYAIRLPGRGGDGTQVWLPIDAKFPREDYERLVDAHDQGELEQLVVLGAQLERAIRIQARSISEKYIVPPATTDFAVMFLPTEGLYAEIIRRPGLVDVLQREHRVVVAGPTTLTALLNSLQMGFRTLAIEQRSSEVWGLLGAVKNEFGKFAGILERAEKQITMVGRSLGDASRKTRTIERRLRGVETLPGMASSELLGVDGPVDEEADDHPGDGMS